MMMVLDSVLFQGCLICGPDLIISRQILDLDCLDIDVVFGVVLWCLGLNVLVVIFEGCVRGLLRNPLLCSTLVRLLLCRLFLRVRCDSCAGSICYLILGFVLAFVVRSLVTSGILCLLCSGLCYSTFTCRSGVVTVA